MTTVASPEDICNLALDAIAYPTAIGSLYEGSRAARIGLRLYGQTRDELLRSRDWNFARQDAVLTLLKTAPVGGFGAKQWTSASPPPPWVYEYAYPANCIQVRSIRKAPIFIPDFDPRPHVFVVANDPALNPPARVILSNVPSAIAVFTAQVTDMTQWEPLFLAAVVERLALQFAKALQPSVVKDAEVEAAAMGEAAAARTG